MQTVKINIGEIYLSKEDIVFVKMMDGIDLEEHHVNEANEQVLKLVGNRKFYTIMDMRDISLGHISTAAFRTHSVNVLTNQNSGEAIVLNSIGIRLLASFYIKTFRPPTPTKIFTSIKEAEAWINKLKKEQLKFNN